MADLVEAHGPFLDGSFVAAEGATFAVDDPATEQVVTEVRGASVAQVEQAIMAARRAFDACFQLLIDRVELEPGHGHEGHG